LLQQTASTQYAQAEIVRILVNAGMQARLLS